MYQFPAWVQPDLVGGNWQSPLASNADMRPTDVRMRCKLEDAGLSPMRSAMSQVLLSARAFHRVLKLTCPIADLAGSEPVQPANLAAEQAIVEALAQEVAGPEPA